MERDKAKMVMDMAFSAAVTGGTFSSSSNAAISKAEYEASQNIAAMHTQYGLKAVDADIAYTSAYTSLNNTFMQGSLDALKDYRSSQQDILGKQFATEDARATAKQTANDKYIDQLNQLGMAKATAISTAAGKITDVLQAEKAAQVEQQHWEATQSQWATDYNFRVDTSNRDFSFQQDTWNKDYAIKQQELTNAGTALQLQDWQNQNAARTTAISTARNDIQSDKNVVAYDSTIKPAWDQFEAAYALPEGTAGRNDAITAAFTQITKGANGFDPNIVNSALALAHLASPQKAAADGDLGGMHDVASAIFTKAQERRNDAISRVSTGVQKANLQFTDNFFKIQPEDYGVATTPMNHEVIQTIDSLPPDTKNKITSYRLGQKNVTTNYEMQLRLQEADRMFYQDTGSHINVNESYRSSSEQADLYNKYQSGTGGLAAPPGSSMHEKGMAVDINPEQWQQVAPYLEKVGLMQLPASVDQNDPAHFSLNGQ